MEELTPAQLKRKSRYLSKEPKKKDEPKWIPPKPIYSIYEINERARMLDMSYGQYVGLMHSKGVKL